MKINIREEIVEKIRQIPENRLPELYEAVEKLVEKETKPTLMERLRKRKIDAPPDFSRNIDLYMSGEKKIDDYNEEKQ